MAQGTPTQFEDRWHAARYHDDLGATVDLVLEAYATDDPPSWMDEEYRRLWGEIASALDADPDDEDTELGRLAIRLSAVREDDYPLALLGLASVGVQRAQRGVPVDPGVPALLHAKLAQYDAVPEDVQSDYVRRWRDLAVARIAALVRRDQESRVADVRDRFLRAVQEGDRTVVRDVLVLLTTAHHELARFAPILEDPDEQRAVFDDLRACEELMAAGRDALRCAAPPSAAPPRTNGTFEQ